MTPKVLSSADAVLRDTVVIVILSVSCGHHSSNGSFQYVQLFTDNLEHLVCCVCVYVCVCVCVLVRVFLYKFNNFEPDT